MIDELRACDRALSPSEVKAEMSTPIASGSTSPAAGLVVAYAYGAGSGTVVVDASGKGDACAIIGRPGRAGLGSAVRCDSTARVRSCECLCRYR
jgi:hypothetical protein